jgi:hypothetical protein
MPIFKKVDQSCGDITEPIRGKTCLGHALK